MKARVDSIYANKNNFRRAISSNVKKKLNAGTERGGGAELQYNAMTETVEDKLSHNSSIIEDCI